MTAPTDRRFAPGTVDAHVHLGLDRYGPATAFLEAMDRTGLAAAVLVQHQGQTDNAYLLDVLRRNPGRFAVLGAFEQEAGPAELRRAAGQGVIGLRTRPEIDLSSASTRRFWRTVDDLGLVVSVIGVPAAIASATFRASVRTLAGTRFRIEHLGGVRHARDRASSPQVGRILDLGAEPNVYVMWSGFWLNAGGARPYEFAIGMVRASLAAFGSDRICWSGDWNRPGPPIGRHITDQEYVREASVVDGAFGIVDPSDRSAILGGTARRLFSLTSSGQEPVHVAAELSGEEVVEQPH